MGSPVGAAFAAATGTRRRAAAPASRRAARARTTIERSVDMLTKSPSTVHFLSGWGRHPRPCQEAAPMLPFPFERPLGAFPQRTGRTEFRVWAPNPETIALRVNGTDHPLEHAGYGIYEAAV